MNGGSATGAAAWPTLAAGGDFDSQHDGPAEPLGHPPLDTAPQIVFIDGSIAGAQALAAGVRAGVIAVILDPNSDGVRQIVDHLEHHGIHDADTIAIVAHGSSGALQIAGTSLSAATLARHVLQLARIGAALRAEGNLLLYGCNVGQAAAGQAFLQLLSLATSGAHVAASSGLVGAASMGGSWTLDVADGTIDVGNPFTASTLADYDGVLINQIWFSQNSSTSNNANTGLATLNVTGSTSTTSNGNVINGASVTNPLFGATALDAADGYYFITNTPVQGTTPPQQILRGSINGGTPTAIYTTPDTNDRDFLGEVVYSPVTNKVYFSVADSLAPDGIGPSVTPVDTGIYSMNIDGSNVTRLVNFGGSSGLVNPFGLAIDAADNLLFFTDYGDSYNTAGSGPGQGRTFNPRIEEANLTTGAILNADLFHIDGSVRANDFRFIYGIDVNPATKSVYWTVGAGVDGGNGIASNNQIFSATYNTAGTALTNVTALFTGTDFTRLVTSISIDAANGVYYAGVGNGVTPLATIVEGSLTSPGTPTTIYTLPADSNGVEDVLFEAAPVLSVTGASPTAVLGGPAVDLTASVTVTDTTQNIASATVTISSGRQTGDTLSFHSGASSWTFADGRTINASYNSTSGVLTLSGVASATDYQAALDSVAFATTSSASTSRTISWMVSDGHLASTTPTSSVTVSLDQTFTATTGVDTFVGGTGNDTFIIPATNTVNAGDTFNGGAGNDTIQIGNTTGFTSLDLSGAASDGVKGFLNIEGIAFINTAPGSAANAVFSSAQFGAGKISNSVVITGGGATGVLGNDNLLIDMATGGSLTLSGWTFANWDGSDRVAITGSTGSETIVGGNEDDTFIVTSTSEVGSGDTYNGGGGTNFLWVGNGSAGSIDFSGAASDGVKGFLDIGVIEFTNSSGTSTATFSSTQFGAGKISNSVLFVGSGAANAVAINMVTNGSLDLSGLSFANWNGSDTITITGSTGIESIVGSSQNDTFVFGAGTVNSGDSFNGGAGTDTIQIGTAGAGTSIDLSGAATDGVHGFLNIEGIAFANTSGSSTATFNSAQFGAGKISNSTTVTGSSGTNTLVVNMATGGSLDLSGWTFNGWTNGVDTITVTGSTGIESIVGSSQDDILSVAAGSLQSGDLYDGGGGTNTLQVTGGVVDFSAITQDASHGVHNIGAVAFSGAGAATATFNGLTQLGSGLVSSTATVTGSALADTLQFFQSAAGSLDLSGLQFANWTSGSDTINVFATSGADTYVGTSQDDTFVFSGGTANAGNSFDGGLGNDTIQVGSTAGGTSETFSTTTLTSIEGLKFVNTSGTSTATFGSAQFGAGNISNSLAITGSAGTNALVINMAAAGSLDLSGWSFTNWTSGADKLTVKGSGGSDTITGSTAADTLNGGAGADVMTGGAGNDVYYVDNAGDQVFEAAGGGTDSVYASVNWTMTAGQEIENLRAYGAGATNGISLTGNAFNNTLIGGTGNDILDGGAGNDLLYGMGGTDTLYGGAGNDALYGGTGVATMYGGTGNDNFVVDNSADKVFENSVEGTDTVYASVNWTMTAGQEIENLRAYGAGATNGISLTGNAFNNTLIGGTGNDILDGGAGNDLLYGMGGTDTLYGGAGNDALYGGTGVATMYGGTGNDNFVVDNSADKVFENSVEGTDTVYASVNWTMTAGQEIENLRAYGAGATNGISLTGNAFNNTLIGGTGNDILDGGAGNDLLYGMGGTDTLYGGAGNDALYGGTGVATMYGGTGNDNFVVDNSADKVFENSVEGTDTVYASVNWTMTAGQEIETLRAYGAGATSGITLTGNNLNNTLVGGSGNDTLDGGAGNDRLVGGAGNDIFAFSTALGVTNVDTISDFSAADDSIGLDQTIFTGLGLGLLSVSAFSLDAATGSNAQIVYNQTTGDLFYDSNGSAAGGSTKFATLTGAPILNNTHFTVA